MRRREEEPKKVQINETRGRARLTVIWTKESSGSAISVEDRMQGNKV
jgi:hypothetical protein